MTWHTEPLVGFDLETTGVDVETARIVTAALVFRTEEGTYNTRSWLADPGVDIPAEAAAVHGITTEKAKADGEPAAEVVDSVTTWLAAAAREGRPLVAMNARYDFTVLDRECRRHGVATLGQRLCDTVGPGPVIDPYILDKQADKYRPGSRRLEALAAHYGVELTAAHTSDADARAAIEVAVAIAEKYPQLQVHPDQLHVWQIRWAAEQAASFQAHKRKTDPYAVIDAEWPLVPLTPERKLRAALADLAERWTPMGLCNDDAPEMAHGRAHAYRKAAADVRNVLRTGLPPHDLMTDAELEKYSAAQ